MRAQVKTTRYFFLIVTLMVNLILISSKIAAFPVNLTEDLRRTGLVMTTCLFTIATLFFLFSNLTQSDNNANIVIPLGALVINLINLLLSHSTLQTDISLLVMVILLISAIYLRYPRRLSHY